MRKIIVGYKVRKSESLFSDNTLSTPIYDLITPLFNYVFISVVQSFTGGI